MKRNFDIFTYKTPDGIQHEYTPDFKINGKYIEIKGYEENIDYIKYESVLGLLRVLRSKDMKPILKEIREKFGKDFIRLYDK